MNATTMPQGISTDDYYNFTASFWYPTSSTCQVIVIKDFIDREKWKDVDIKKGEWLPEITLY